MHIFAYPTERVVVQNSLKHLLYILLVYIINFEGFFPSSLINSLIFIQFGSKLEYVLFIFYYLSIENIQSTNLLICREDLAVICGHPIIW